jgi:hypothetical protein
MSKPKCPKCENAKYVNTGRDWDTREPFYFCSKCQTWIKEVKEANNE